LRRSLADATGSWLVRADRQRQTPGH